MQGKGVALFKPMSTEFLEEFSPRGERPLGSSSYVSFLGILWVIEYWIAGRPQGIGCLPYLGLGQGCMVDL